MDFVKLARDIGFEDVRGLKMSSLRALPEVREMCAADKCGAFGKCWTCPPACGSVNQCAARLSKYNSGFLVKTVGKLENESDAEGITTAMKLHSRRFARLARQVRLLCPDCLPLTAGSCTRCPVCTYPSSPCRFPSKSFSSMEAYGLLVSDVCDESEMPYSRGGRSVTFVSCVLFNSIEMSEENI